ncbi:hypothetical protein TH53_02475 [Pedobacter lusitanus]|uniref:Bacterial sugar transferase domain-containing protein n=1 Tax=Pedobacter lusitanus TaxID=1503925 RepID=A0A0D0GQZ7_9SPHI|nr:sugar transferase [Pedobacter lusitanus]KIO78630.1 hypothetical protein TH53_02475 [Pedobacter lusitanus]
MYKLFFKQTLDIIIALVGLVILFPVFIIVLLLLYFANNGKPFFFQVRPGKNGNLFKIIKFKTMNDKRGSDGVLLPDSARLTAVGAFVRMTSLDELPQLLNVIKGDMSLVGPRPLLPEYLPLYSKEQNRRHEVRPGITGWAQVNGRNAISWTEKFTLDVWYVNNLSFWLDLKIILLTIKKVIVKEGISSDTSATMEKFTGN